jgi:menaquinol-cytochrome c reductase iron-sulfur subunit
MSSDERPAVPPAGAEDPPAAVARGSEEELPRRRFLTRVGGGLVAAALGAPAALAFRACVPNALYEQPLRFKAGPIASFTGGATFLPEQRVFVFREAETFHCISAVCTHLGCTVQLARSAPGAAGPAASGRAAETVEFHCPCHGSKYRGDGTPYAGPAPRPLDYFKLDVAPDDGQLVVDLAERTDKGWRLTVAV